ncbi:MAG TPA: SPOR domain-containing protein [Accumulibacter sp.]|nr:SPOR domain-containing protein [Accumulibacter sp.]HNC18418.1 SPOR domain-containing protein [Accumulibacter sp.]HND81044.1 SPOR domain-containing protein [Accumulibacter sp.]HNE14290.1 SPOR domain-containing protein [Accumulibacter sp.]HNG38926.1 SPOR domain-containing protein [Accumulibacter sp.]
MAMKKDDTTKKVESAVPPSIKPFSRLGDDWHLDLRKQLLRRIGVAALLIFTLLGGLALYDSLNSPSEFDDEEDARDPRTSRAIEPAKPIKPAPADSATNSTAPAAVPDKTTPGDAVPAPAPATVAAAPAAATATAAAHTPVAPVTPPIPTVMPAQRAGAAAGTPATAITPPTSPAAPRPTSGGLPATVPAMVGQSPAGVTAPPPPEIAAKPELPTAPADDAARAVSPPRGERLPRSGYLLQSPVVSDAARAEELQAQLAKMGIPSVIETRLQVGPFPSRAAAEAARRQMSALGIEGTVQRIKPGPR